MGEERAREEEDMKDVACVVRVPKDGIGTYSVYLIDIARQKLRGLINLNNYPLFMGLVVHKCMLYMFGGVCREAIGNRIGLCDAYQFDLFQLAKTFGCTDDEHKPLPMKLPQMNYGKTDPIVLPVGNKFCVFDTILGYKPRDTHFEVFDPDNKSWSRVPDPFRLKGTFSVDVHLVKDDNLFLYISDKPGIYMLNFGAIASPIWTHLNISYYFSEEEFDDILIHQIRGVIIGSLLVGLDNAYALSKKGCVTHWVGCVSCTGRTAIERYDVFSMGLGEIFRFGSDNKVCTIYPLLVRKLPQDKPKAARFNIKKSMFVQQPVLRKSGRQRKGSHRFLVNVCSVDTSGSQINMEVLKSFTVPMYDDDDGVELGFIRTASLCDP